MKVALMILALAVLLLLAGCKKELTQEEKNHIQGIYDVDCKEANRLSGVDRAKAIEKAEQHKADLIDAVSTGRMTELQLCDEVGKAAVKYGRMREADAKIAVQEGQAAKQK